MTILIADDHPDNAKLLARRLAREGYQFVTAGDGVQALEQVQAVQPDLLLLDVDMPRMNGFDVVAALRRDPAFAHLPVIMVTAARLTREDMHAGLGLGADDYVMKPFDWEELALRIRAKLRVKHAEDALRRRNQALELLPAMAAELRAGLPLEDLLAIVLDYALRVTQASAGLVTVFDDEGENRCLRATPGFPTRTVQSMLYDLPAAPGGVLLAADPQEPPATLALGLASRRGPLGGIVLQHPDPGHFNAERQALLGAIASQATIAVKNALLVATIEARRLRFEAILNSAADAVLVFNAVGALELCNQAAEQLLVPGHARLGSPLPEGADFDALRRLLDREAPAGSARQGQIPWPDGRTFVAVITDLDDGGQVAVLHDVTHFKELDRLKNEFVAVASHDLKGPITVVQGYADLLDRVGPLNPAQLQMVARIREVSHNMHSLVVSLLDMAQIETGVGLRQAPCALAVLLNDVHTEFAVVARNGGRTLDLIAPERLPGVQGDSVRLRQVLTNLLGNALKYTPPPGGVRLVAWATDDALCVEVRDDGPGIPAADLPYLFDKFYRTGSDATRDYEGHGLGLAIVKSIVEQHGGRVWVNSTLGQGSTFGFSLPVAHNA